MSDQISSSSWLMSDVSGISCSFSSGLFGYLPCWLGFFCLPLSPWFWSYCRFVPEVPLLAFGMLLSLSAGLMPFSDFLDITLFPLFVPSASCVMALMGWPWHKNKSKSSDSERQFRRSVWENYWLAHGESKERTKKGIKRGLKGQVGISTVFLREWLSVWECQTSVVVRSFRGE